MAPVVTPRVRNARNEGESTDWWLPRDVRTCHGFDSDPGAGLTSISERIHAVEDADGGEGREEGERVRGCDVRAHFSRSC